MDSIIDVYKTDKGKIINFADFVHSKDTIEMVTLLALNKPVSDFIYINGEPFDWLKWAKLIPKEE